jgi:hypothetical protein
VYVLLELIVGTHRVVIAVGFICRSRRYSYIARVCFVLAPKVLNCLIRLFNPELTIGVILLMRVKPAPLHTWVKYYSSPIHWGIIGLHIISFKLLPAGVDVSTEVIL